MDGNQIIVLVLLGVSLILFVSQALAVELVALLVALSLMATGILTPADAVAGLSSPAVVAVACMFIVSAGLTRTGVLERVSHRFITRVGKGRSSFMIFVLMIVVGILSAFINNTPIVVMFIPIILALAREFDIPPSKLLIPLSFSAMFGGSCTLIGTSTNIIVSLLSEESGHRAFGMFEPTRLGILFFVVGMVYMTTFGRRILPVRPGLVGLEGSRSQELYAAELKVCAESPLIGKPASLISANGELVVVQIIRDGSIMRGTTEDVTLEEGDVLLLSGKASGLVDIQQKKLLTLPEELGGESVRFDPKNMMLMELLVRHDGDWVGQTIAGLKLRQRRRMTVMALQRGGQHVMEKLSDVILRAGDIVLAFGEENVVRNFVSTNNYIVLDDVQDHVVYRNKARLAMLILVLIVLGAGLFGLPILPLALGGAVAMVMGRCVSLKEAYRAVDLRLLLLLAGMMALGKAIHETGLASLLSYPIKLSASLGTWAAVGTTYLFATLLASVVTTATSAVLLVPVVLDVAPLLGFDDPTGLLMAVMFGASACFLSPIGYQTNVLVYTPGNYRFTDFTRVGAPLTVAFAVISAFLIPRLWPF
jgi:di/tricarboxylate transporter